MALDLLKQLYSALLDMESRLGSVAARPTKTLTMLNSTTLTALAKVHGNSLKEVMSLNLPLLKSPDVPAGASVVLYS